MISNTVFDTTITASTVNVDMKLKELDDRITNLEDSTINSNSSFKSIALVNSLPNIEDK